LPLASVVNSGHLSGFPYTCPLTYVKVSPSFIQSRIEQRQGHFMATTLLPYQFQALEEPCPEKETEFHTMAVDMEQMETAEKVANNYFK
jgi:gluconate kinase